MAMLLRARSLGGLRRGAGVLTMYTATPSLVDVGILLYSSHNGVP